MSHDRLERLEELLAEALQLPPGQREAYLERTCRDDPELLREAEELIGVHDDATAYFEVLSSQIASASGRELSSAARPRIGVGPYRTLEAVGHGGMGAVYRAERVDGAFEQQVALKLLHRDMETPELEARFLAERQILARLDHPNIARLLDGGVTEEGRPYFVMEYVEGVPITRYCAAHRLSVDAVLRLFLVVIDAVSYLHRNLVVHRDLKPSNILVDRAGRVKLLDFGIAKLLVKDPGGGLTVTGERLMTPEYAAPEQLSGAPVTTATDVYALGVVLYELLTGRRPHERPSEHRRTPSRDLPPTPSSRLRARRHEQATEAGDAAPVPWRRVAGDLDTICLKALRPEPEGRYPSAEQLGQDLERHLQGLPVRARRSTVAYRVGKFAGRHRKGLLAAAALLVVIGAGFLRERGLRNEAERARSDAQLQAARAEAVSDFLGELLSSVSPMKAQGREVTVAEVLDQAAGRIADSPELVGRPAVEASIRRTIGNTYVALGRNDDAREHLERAVELSGGLEASTPEGLAAASDLGVLEHYLGRFEEAETILRRVLERRLATLGEEAPESLTAMNRLADLMWSLGRLDELEKLDRRTLEIRRRLLGEDHPDTLKSLNGLAATLFNRGRYGEAAQIFEQALAAARRQLGELHPHTLALSSNLAASYLELGRYADAEALHRTTLDARIAVLGESHPETALSLHNLGVTLAEQARWDEAEEKLRRAMAVRDAIPGDRRSALFSASHLADVLRDRGRLAEAEALYLVTLERQREELGPEDGDTLETVGSLAELRLVRGELADAEELLTGISAPQRQARGAAHPDSVGTLVLLARIRNRQGRYGEALALADDAVAIGGEGLGAEHPVVLHALLERARSLSGLGRTSEGAEVVERVLAARSNLLGEAHPDTVEAGELLEALRRQDDGPALSRG